MKLTALAAVLGVATLAATGCERAPTSRTAYNNSGASATATAPEQVNAPAPPNIAPPPQGLAIPSTVPSEPAQPAPANPGANVVPATPGTASPALPPAGAQPGAAGAQPSVAQAAAPAAQPANPAPAAR